MPSRVLLAVIYLAFVSLGLPDSVLGVAWPDMRRSLGAPLEAAGLIAILLTVCSAVASVFSGPLNRIFGTGVVVLGSCALTVVGLLGYSLAPSYGWVLVAALPLGAGGGAVDSSLNAYVAAHCASRHMNWLHAFWGAGATLGPIVMTEAMVRGLGWRGGYQAIAALQGCLALLTLATLRQWSRTLPVAHTNAGTAAGRIRGLRRPEPWVQISMFMLYSACEFSVGIWGASLLVEARQQSAATAGLWIALYYGGIMAGRLLTGMVADRMGNRLMARAGLVMALTGALLLTAREPDWLALPGLLLLGFGFAPVYPSLMHETPRRFEERTTQLVIGFQVGAACLGASALPSLVGLAAAHSTLEILGPWLVMGVVALLVANEWLNRKS